MRQADEPNSTATGASRGWRVALGLVLLAVLLITVALFMRTVWRSFLGLENQVAAAVIVGSSTILVSVLSLTGARHWERRNEREREIRAKKVPVYEKFIGDWLDLMFTSKNGGLDENAARKFFMALTPQLTIWGSEDVVASWSRLRREWARAGQGDGSAPMEMMFEFEALLMKIRRDLGHSNQGLQQGDLLGLWVNDIHEYVPTLLGTKRVA